MKKGESVPGNLPSLPRLFMDFLRLGVTAFGGPAMVASIRKLAVMDRRWLDENAFRNGVALCQAIPGATAMQVAAYVGLKLRGARGAALSFLGFGLPAFLLMLGLSILYGRFHALPAVTAVFTGLHALVIAILVNASYAFGRSYLKRWRDLVVAVGAALLFWFNVTPVLIVPAAAALGILFSLKKGEGKKIPDRTAIVFRPFPLIALAGSALLGLIFLLMLYPRLFELSLVMMKVDLFAFGGGFSSAPLMMREIVDVRGWLSRNDFMNGLALGQVTPGPIVITSTFVGYLTGGPGGALIATMSVFFPSFLMVIGVEPFFARLSSLPLFRGAAGGILCSFVGLLASTAVRMGLAVSWTVPDAILAAAALGALLFRVELMWVMLFGVTVLLVLQ